MRKPPGCRTVCAVVGLLLFGCAGTPDRGAAPPAAAVPEAPVALPTPLPPAAVTPSPKPTPAPAPEPPAAPLPVPPLAVTPPWAEPGPEPLPAPLDPPQEEAAPPPEEPLARSGGDAPVGPASPLPTVPAASPEELPVPESAPARAEIAVPDRLEVQAAVREFAGPLRRSTEDALRRGARYLPMMEEIFAEEAVPLELAYLPLVESHFLPAARSSAGALGLWQFIPSTARAAGLRVDWWVDERLDPERATRAAARHLRELHERFGDWELALAAYNAGAGGVSRAIGERGSADFWELAGARRLRAETRRYVPKFYAALTLVRDPEGYGLALEDPDPGPPWETLWVEEPVDLGTVARLSGTSLRTLRALNPSLKRGCTPPGESRYPLRLEVGSGAAVAQGLADLPAERRLNFLRHRVRSGDTLWGIARRYGTHHRAIAELNEIGEVRSLRPGRELVVPVPRRERLAQAPRPATGAALARPVWVVAAGDTVAAIARRTGVSVADVLAWNGLGQDGLVRPGERLFVGPQEPAAREGGRAVVHTVQQGDTLWDIARRYGVSLDDLMRRNGLAEEHLLRPGDRLEVATLWDDPT